MWLKPTKTNYKGRDAYLKNEPARPDTNDDCRVVSEMNRTVRSN